jgi:hypothetical protein
VLTVVMIMMDWEQGAGKNISVSPYTLIQYPRFTEARKK